MSKRKKKAGNGQDEHFVALEYDDSHVKDEDGCVTRCIYEEKDGKRKCKFPSHDYRENGFNYQKGCAEVKWYNLPIHEKGSDAQKRFHAVFTTAFKQVWRDPSKREKAWYMGDGPYAHINFISGGWWPWGNNAHHLIPVDDALNDETVLNFDQRKLLQQAKYNVNKGINIIYLPTGTRHATLFQLLKHPRYHSTYSQAVRTRVKAVRDNLTKGADEDEDGHPQLNEQTVGKLGEQLHAFSGRLREQIRAAGIKSPGAHLNELARLVPVR
ncbi:MAG: AHH domain-containing protein [Hyalangium sp.]|uniref:AHH domain-containing protein n=1 Tax=Hyalangium sp. TaxID=2028555 RepID=UPI00389A38FD